MTLSSNIIDNSAMGKLDVEKTISMPNRCARAAHPFNAGKTIIASTTHGLPLLISFVSLLSIIIISVATWSATLA